MTHPAVTITPGESIERAARLICNCRVRWLPVVDADGRLIEIISRADVLAAFDRTDEEMVRTSPISWSRMSSGRIRAGSR